MTVTDQVSITDEEWDAVEAGLDQRTQVERLIYRYCEKQYYADMKSFEQVADRHGVCLPSGLTIEECAAGPCDCGFEYIVDERDRLKEELADQERIVGQLRDALAEQSRKHQEWTRGRMRREIELRKELDRVKGKGFDYKPRRFPKEEYEFGGSDDE